MPSFSGGHWFMVADVASWIPDFAATMQYHEALLQTLQHGAPKCTWVCKTPVYMMMLDLAFATYPDAWILNTHRDPVKTAPSGLSTLATVRWERSDEGMRPTRQGVTLRMREITQVLGAISTAARRVAAGG